MLHAKKKKKKEGRKEEEKGIGNISKGQDWQETAD